MHKYTQTAGQQATPDCPVLIKIQISVERERVLTQQAARRAELDAKLIAETNKRRAERADFRGRQIERNATAADLSGKLAEPENGSKRRKKSAAPPAELSLDTLDVKPPPLEHPEEAKKLRSKCLGVGKWLVSRGDIRKELCKAGKKIKNCRVIGMWQEVSPTVHYKIGSALCKQRFCPNCQRVLSAKRRANTLRWFELNRPQLRKYFFYHLVLTVPHSVDEGVRTGLYVSELLRCFALLRGTAQGMPGKARARAASWWSSWVAGSLYYVENKPGKDGSPHIHLHCIVLAHKQLWNAKQDSQFLIECGPRWAAITGNQKLFQGVFVDPVYYIDEETKKRVNCHFGSSMNLESAFSEASKYTMKTDTATLEKFSDDFLAEMLTTRNRYYGRTGCLNAKDPSSKQFKQLDMLCTDFKDLEEADAKEAMRLFNPETGEIVNKEDTRIVVTPARNMLPTEKTGWVENDKTRSRKDRRAGEKITVGEMVYKLEKQAGYTIYYPHWDRGRAVARMGAGMSNDYDASLDIL